MMFGSLPTELTVNGKVYEIRTDYRDILNILIAFEDPDLENNEKLYVCLVGLYKDFSNMPIEDYEEAYKQAMWFISVGNDEETKAKRKVMDWEQDEQLIFPAVNKVAGCETRSQAYIHWWTFMGYFMEISEGVYSYVLTLRQKKQKKKLDKEEQAFWDANKHICELKPKLSREEREAKERLLKMLS